MARYVPQVCVCVRARAHTSEMRACGCAFGASLHSTLCRRLMRSLMDDAMCLSQGGLDVHKAAYELISDSLTGRVVLSFAPPPPEPGVAGPLFSTTAPGPKFFGAPKAP